MFILGLVIGFGLGMVVAFLYCTYKLYKLNEELK